jgi:hypothetical protein
MKLSWGKQKHGSQKMIKNGNKNIALTIQLVGVFCV